MPQPQGRLASSSGASPGPRPAVQRRLYKDTCEPSGPQDKPSGRVRDGEANSEDLLTRSERRIHSSINKDLLSICREPGSMQRLWVQWQTDTMSPVRVLTELAHPPGGWCWSQSQMCVCAYMHMHPHTVRKAARPRGAVCLL